MKLTEEELQRAEAGIAALRAVMEKPPARKEKADLGAADLLAYPRPRYVRERYDSDAMCALFTESGWSDYQTFLAAVALAVEHSGQNACREIQKLSRGDMALSTFTQVPPGRPQ